MFVFNRTDTNDEKQVWVPLQAYIHKFKKFIPRLDENPKCNQLHFLYPIETWILYRGNDYEVSKLVENAYQHYENLEFGIERVDIGDPRRHIKLINISGKEDEKDRKSKVSIFVHYS